LPPLYSIPRNVRLCHRRIATFSAHRDLFDCSYLTTNWWVSCRVGTKLSTTYINDIYYDSITIFLSKNNHDLLIFLIFSKYQPLLLLFTYFSNTGISNTNCPSPWAIRWCKNIAENFNP